MVSEKIRKKAMKKMLDTEEKITKTMVNFIKTIPEKKDKRYDELLSIEKRKLKLIEKLRKVV